MPATPPTFADERELDFSGGNQVHLLSGGDQLFPAMHEAIAAATRDIWLATYIFHDDTAGEAMAERLAGAARRGVRVRVVVDGFGSKPSLPSLRRWFAGSGVALAVFRPLDRWTAWLQPGQLRRLHQKLFVVDDELAFVGGINILDDRLDLNHGVTETPRLDFAVSLRGPVVAPVAQTARALWTRAAFGQEWREELVALARSAEPVARARALIERLRMPDGGHDVPPASLPPVRAAFVVRDNLRRRRDIERSYIEALQRARERIDLVSPYFYPGRIFRRTLRNAARRGVRVRLLLQGKLDFRIAGLAAQVLYDELLGHGVRIYEYTPAFLHAKVALADDDWATVGSSNIDPLSLLLNLEANVVVRDVGFTADLAHAFEQAIAVSREVTAPPQVSGWMGALRRGFVAWLAHWFLRLAGLSGRY
ncbi:MAG TPA: cardiolipin synthase ClsB [Burkholderiaceae bacterium]|nr:cardiolipin synthase ClsB [Burkholderiaceae bacterium]